MMETCNDDWIRFIYPSTKPPYNIKNKPGYRSIQTTSILVLYYVVHGEPVRGDQFHIKLINTLAALNVLIYQNTLLSITVTKI